MKQEIKTGINKESDYEEFNDKFKNDIEPELRLNFLKFYYTLNCKFSNVLFNADEEHVNDFVDMIKYHLTKK